MDTPLAKVAGLDLHLKAFTPKGLRKISWFSQTSPFSPGSSGRFGRGSGENSFL
jgi:hypothetical protein